MNENIIKTNVVLDKKTGGYVWEPNDFAAESELTVTITLSEYRELIASNATKKHDIAKANEDKYSKESENRALKEEVERLKAIIFDLQGKSIESI